MLRSMQNFELRYFGKRTAEGVEMEGIKTSSLDRIKLVPIGISRVQVLGKLKNEFQSPLFQWGKDGYPLPPKL